MQRESLRANNARKEELDRLEVVEWVNKNKGLICNAIYVHYQRCPEDIKDELLCDAMVVALEAAEKARRKGKSFEALFWTDFRFMLKGSVEFHVIYDTELVENAAACDDMTHRIIEKFAHEERVAHVINNALQVLSPREQDLFLLITGETVHGRCSLPEAAGILGMAETTVAQLRVRITAKISQATKVYYSGGKVDLFSVRPYEVKKGRPSSNRGRGSFVSEDTNHHPDFGNLSDDVLI